MTKTEKLSAIAIGIVSGIAIAYIRETKRLERLNRLQDEQIERLKEYIEWTEEDYSTVYTRKL